MLPQKKKLLTQWETSVVLTESVKINPVKFMLPEEKSKVKYHMKYLTFWFAAAVCSHILVFNNIYISKTSLLYLNTDNFFVFNIKPDFLQRTLLKKTKKQTFMYYKIFQTYGVWMGSQRQKKNTKISSACKKNYICHSFDPQMILS